MHVPDDSQGLHVWGELFGAPAGPGNQLRGLAGGITDAEGWTWRNHGEASARATTFGRAVELFGLDFAGFPRWQPTLEMEMVHEDRQDGRPGGVLLGRHRLSNPVQLVHPLTNWPVQPLPQRVEQDGLQVTLKSLSFRRSWRDAATEGFTGRFPPSVDVQLDTQEWQDGEFVTGRWHAIQSSFFDNFGNCSHEGLPPRTPESRSMPMIQWRISVKLVGDHTSRLASNAFVVIPSQALPAPGTYVTAPPPTPPVELGPLSVSAWQLFGSGTADFKGPTVTHSATANSAGTGVTESHRSSQNANGTVSLLLTLSSGSPFVVATLDGPTEGLWFSCRAENAKDGTVRWLRRYGDPEKSPSFERVFNNADRIWFAAPGLATDGVWSFTLGVHQPREVSFHLDRPLWEEETGPESRTIPGD